MDEHAVDSGERGSAPGFGAGVPGARRAEKGAVVPRSATSGEAAPAARPAGRRGEPALAARAREAAERGAFGAPACGHSAGGDLASGPLARAALDALSAAPSRGDRAPSAADVGAAIESATQDPGFGRAAALALRPHWSEPALDWTARALAALARGSRVVVEVDSLLWPVAAALEDAAGRALPGVDGPVLQAVRGSGLEGVRAAAGLAEVELDVTAPDDFATGLSVSLERMRSGAPFDEEALARARAHARTHSAFGIGVADEPRARVHVRAPLGVTLGYGARAGAVDVSLDDSGSIEDAAERAAELAFGPAVLGGYGARAAARLVVDAGSFSDFTAALLAVLDGARHLGPPAWLEDADGRPARALDAATQAARRIGLDEGATLVHERRAAGARRLLFTNVERRMRLASHLRGPAVLSLLRGLD
ncbi:MAG: hypothetical protein AAFP86_09025 [Planctomycetota bacterium]